MERKLAIVLTAAVLAMLLATLVGIIFYKRIHSTGKIKTIGCEVYWDDTTTEVATFVEWGILEPGSQTSKLLFVKITSNYLTNLTLGTDMWEPANASDYIILSWDYDGHLLNPQEVIPVKLYLDISEDIHGIEDFTFDIVIIASG